MPNKIIMHNCSEFVFVGLVSIFSRYVELCKLPLLSSSFWEKQNWIYQLILWFLLLISSRASDRWYMSTICPGFRTFELSLVTYCTIWMKITDSIREGSNLLLRSIMNSNFVRKFWIFSWVFVSFSHKNLD